MNANALGYFILTRVRDRMLRNDQISYDAARKAIEPAFKELMREVDLEEIQACHMIADWMWDGTLPDTN